MKYKLNESIGPFKRGQWIEVSSDLTKAHFEKRSALKKQHKKAAKGGAASG